MATLSLAQVSFAYSKGTPFEKEALRQISCAFSPAELVGIIGQTGNKFRRNAEVRQRHCHISLAATICSNKFISLRKAAETGRSKP